MKIDLSKRYIFAIAILCVVILPSFAWRGIPIEVGLPFNIRTDFHPEYKCMYNEDDEFYGYYHYEYDDDGNLISETYTPVYNTWPSNNDPDYAIDDDTDQRPVRKSQFETEYDDLGRVITYYSFWGSIPTGVEKYEYGDPVLTNLPTLYIQLSAMEKCAQKYDITRNEYGNVVSAYHYKADWQPIEEDFDFKEDFHINVEYNEQQEAEKIEYYGKFHRWENQTFIPYIALKYTYDNIVWRKTDGQIIDNSNPYGPVYWTEGGVTDAWNATTNIRNKGNLIYSAVQTTYSRDDYGEIKYTSTDSYNVEYTDTEGEFTVYHDDEWMYAVKVLDDRGGYSLNERIYTWDPWGKQLDYGHPDWWHYNPSKWVEAKYDSVTGFPIEYKTRTNGYWEYDHWYGSYTTTTEKFISPYSNWIDEISDSDLSESVQYFDLNGLKVDESNLLPGIYIIRQGNHSQKVRI